MCDNMQQTSAKPVTTKEVTCKLLLASCLIYAWALPAHPYNM